MRHCLFFVYTALTLAAALAEGQTSQAQRVQFETGKSDATVRGQIQGYQTAEYLVRAGAGQTMNVSLETQQTSTYFNVFAPGSQPGRDAALFSGATSGKSFDGKLTIPGDYRIQAFMMRSAARRNETAEYSLSVRIDGTADVSMKGPEAGPWPVDTDASGELPCSAGGGELDLRCPFRVKRNTYGATIWVIKAGETRDPAQLKFEELRTVYFEKVGNDEDGFSTNDAAKMSWEREDDNWIVTVGEERYWIPDAVIYGG